MKRETAEQFSPFGEADCESEVKILQEEYHHYFFHQTRFNGLALNPKVFLIVGRRGAGKTALAHYFSFQKELRQAIAIDVDEPAAFDQVLHSLPEIASYTREVAVPRITKLWEFILWSILFYALQNQDGRIRAACIFGNQAGTLPHFIRITLRAMLNRLLQTDTDVLSELELLIADDRIQAGKAAVLELAKRQPVLIAIDTLENYEIQDVNMMRAIAALVQCASDFNREYARRGIHLKLFIMAEVFSYLKEEVILNPLKSVRDEVYLHWRPKDLMRLICWRLYQYLLPLGQLSRKSVQIDWDDYNDVRVKMWNPYFGDTLESCQGFSEQTFPYILRHTQMRPRQLIVLCNAIANRAVHEGIFPKFDCDTVIAAVQYASNALAEEVFNSYSSVYPRVGRIAEALCGIPMIFKGSELDRRAPLTASEWPPGEYSPFAFRQLVAELGIVGRVRQGNEKAGYAEVDFEYNSESRLPLMVDNICAIHPMFYRKLNVAIKPNLRVYPFPEHKEFRDLNYAHGLAGLAQ